MDIIYVEYRKKGFTVADAFRRDPEWGMRNFTVDPKDLSTTDKEEIERAARQTAPEGYELLRITFPESFCDA